MEIKDGLNVSTAEFWYDLSKGGYLKPKEICEKEEDAQRVIKAVKVIEDFESSCEEQIEDFIR